MNSSFTHKALFITTGKIKNKSFEKIGGKNEAEVLKVLGENPGKVKRLVNK